MKNNIIFTNYLHYFRNKEIELTLLNVIDLNSFCNLTDNDLLNLTKECYFNDPQFCFFLLSDIITFFNDKEFSFLKKCYFHLFLLNTFFIHIKFHNQIERHHVKLLMQKTLITTFLDLDGTIDNHLLQITYFFFSMIISFENLLNKKRILFLDVLTLNESSTLINKFRNKCWSYLFFNITPANLENKLSLLIAHYSKEKLVLSSHLMCDYSLYFSNLKQLDPNYIKQFDSIIFCSKRLLLDYSYFYFKANINTKNEAKKANKNKFLYLDLARIFLKEYNITINIDITEKKK